VNEKRHFVFQLQAGKSGAATFLKCAAEVSHPHWAAWSPTDELNFHLPRCFGELTFGS
jgi:hypothetical protein